MKFSWKLMKILSTEYFWMWCIFSMSWNFMEFHETFWKFMNFQGNILNFMKLSEIFINDETFLKHNSFMKFHENFHNILWRFSWKLMKKIFSSQIFIKYFMKISFISVKLSKSILLFYEISMNVNEVYNDLHVYFMKLSWMFHEIYKSY